MKRFIYGALWAFSLVFTASWFTEAQVTIPYSFTSGNTIQSAQVNSNFSAVGAGALNRTGGTMTGTLTSQTILPAITATYDIGSSSFKFNVAHIVDGSDISALNADKLASGTVATARLGSGTASGNYLRGDNTWQTVAEVPAGTVIFYDGSSCPTGYAEFTSARGRYIVGLPSGGTLDATTGTALTNSENRATGQHTHTASSSVPTVTDPGHSHRFSADHSGLGGGPGDFAFNGGSTFESSVIESSTTGISVAAPTITVTNTGSVVGTNAPYIQLIACKKS